ncbi:MAG TPA: hypothetical protein PLA18_07710 [Deltaproteobacteria bacterium]|nr:hypothetical protein [Deltaproteobacteria bacterium]
MEAKSSSHLTRSAAFRDAAVAEGFHAGKFRGTVLRAIGRNQEEAGSMTGATKAAMAVSGSKSKISPAVSLLLIFVA